MILYFKRFMPQRTFRKGFTLIELMVVIAIIGILASVTLAQFQQARAKARDIIRVTDMKAIMTALQLYYNDNGRFPCRGLLDDSTQAGFLAPLVAGNYINEAPRDSINQSPHIYYYATFRDSTAVGAPCGQIAHLSFDAETDGTPCVQGVYHSSLSSHCHIMFLKPIPAPCGDPYLQTGTWPPIGSCGAFLDTVNQY